MQKGQKHLGMNKWGKGKNGKIRIGEILGGTDKELGRTEKRLGIRMNE